jgi:AcrR family transcriptional regulator
MTRANARDALIDAALVEFSEHGYDATTVAGIAERAGVTTGALYAQFGSKLELLVATIGLASPSEYAATLARAFAVPVEQSADVFDERTALSGERRLLLLDVIVLARRDPEVAATLRRGFEAYLAATSDAIEKGVASGALDPAMPPTDLARLGAALSLGHLVLEALGERPPARRAFIGLTEALLRNGRAAPEGLDPALARVRARAAAVHDETARLHEAIAAAAAAGYSLRRIGEAAGLSHERVRRLLSTVLTNSA